MDIPEILQGDVHLPLVEHMTAATAIPLANSFYQTSLVVGDFQDSQAVESGGRLVLDLIDRSNGQVVVTFVNKATPVVEEEEEIELFNVFTNATPTQPWLAPPLRLLNAVEMVFLDDLGSGNTCPPHGGDDFPWKLSQLLNGHNLLGGWTSGTLGYRCTGEFTLVYKGPVSDAPEEFLVGEGTECAIIKINHGKDLGYLCLVS